MVAKFTSVFPSGWVRASSEGSPILRIAFNTSPGVTCAFGVSTAVGGRPKHSVPRGSQSPETFCAHSRQRRSARSGQLLAWPQSTGVGLPVGALIPTHTEIHL